jgi:hypothetical protein
MSAAQTTATPNPTTPFAERAIDLTFQLGSGTFTNTQSNILKVTGLRVQATIQIPGAVPLQGSAQVSVWGLPLQVMNDLSSLGSMLYTSRDNQIIIEAGDVGGQMSAVFTGSIFQAYADFEAGPDAPFEIVASPGYHAQIQGATPTSYAGAVNVTTILSALCEKVGLTFQSNGVNVILSNPYLPGTLIDQIEGWQHPEWRPVGLVEHRDHAFIGPCAVGRDRDGRLPAVSAQRPLRKELVQPRAEERRNLQGSVASDAGQWHLAELCDDA